MESQKAENPDAAVSERSTIEFPYTDVDNAQEIVRGVHSVGGTACTYEQLAAHLGSEPKGGGFRLRVTGAKSYGYIEYERGGTIKITELGFQVLEPATERAAKVQGFLNVPLFAKVFDEFKGRQLPPQAGLERAIKTFGVGAKVADRARQVMLRAAKQAAFMELQPDRLTLPPVKLGEKTEQKKDEIEKPKTGGGNDGGNLHPFIKGLLDKLPAPDSNWPIQARAKWLETASNIFDLMYKAEPDDNLKLIEIKLVSL